MKNIDLIKSVALLSFALLAARQQSHADTVANYTFDGNSRASSDTNSQSTATAFSDGAGLAGGTSLTNFNGNPAPSLFLSSSRTAASEVNAVAQNDYFSFTVSPNPGLQLQFTLLKFETQTIAGSGAHTATYFVRTSIDNFTTTIGSGTFVGSSGGSAFIAIAIDLKNLLVQGGPTEFRIYVFDTSDVDGLNGSLLDNIILSANVHSTVQPAIYNAVELAYPTETGRTYQIQMTPSLSPATWTNFGPQVVGDGTEKAVFDQTRNGEKRFYRVLKLE